MMKNQQKTRKNLPLCWGFINGSPLTK